MYAGNNSKGSFFVNFQTTGKALPLNKFGEMEK